MVYPGMCLLEGTNLSEGRGTCRPFEQFGAPYLDADDVAEALERHALPGLRLRPVHFVPTWDKHHGVRCAGAFLHVTDPAVFPSVRTGLAVVAAGATPRRVRPSSGGPRRTSSSPTCRRSISCAGNGRVRQALENGADFEEVAALLDGAETAFLERRAACICCTGRLVPYHMDVALLGGSFNPPHLGHLLAAHVVRALEPVDEVWFVPAAHHPFGKPLIDFSHRLAMCELMCRDAAGWLAASDIEASLGGRGLHGGHPAGAAPPLARPPVDAGGGQRHRLRASALARGGRRSAGWRASWS